MKKFTNEEIEFIQNNYNKISTNDIALKLNRSRKSISYKCQNLGLVTKDTKKIQKSLSSNKKYIDSNFFTNNSNAPYWAGFLMADGWIDNNRICLQLSIKDEQHLQRFKNDIQSDATITHITKGANDLVKTTRQMCQIRISDIHTIEILKNKYNIISNKSNRLTFPLLTDEETLKFIVGYIDGDGSLIKMYNNKLCIKFASQSKDFMQSIVDLFNQWAPKHKQRKQQSVIRETKIKGFYEYKISGTRAEIVYCKLMSINCPRLDRKWKIWEYLLCK